MRDAASDDETNKNQSLRGEADAKMLWVVSVVRRLRVKCS